MRDISVPDWPWPRTSALEEGAGGIRHILTATLVVDHVAATKPETVIVQIHGSIDEEIAKIVKLRWTGGLVEARVILLLLFHSSTFSPGISIIAFAVLAHPLDCADRPPVHADV